MRICLTAIPSTPRSACTNAAAEWSLDEQARRIKEVNPKARVILCNGSFSFSVFLQCNTLNALATSLALHTQGTNTPSATKNSLTHRTHVQCACTLTCLTSPSPTCPHGADRNTELGLSPYHDQCEKMYDPAFGGFWLQANGTILNDPGSTGEFTPCDPPLNASVLVQDQ
jgi:hypothetical protein